MRQAEPDPLGEGRKLEPGLILALTLKAACGRRIRAVMKDTETQLNLTAWATDLADRKASGQPVSKAEQADIETARAARLWVREMQAKCKELIGAGDAAFDDDAKWPKPPAVTAELADRF